MQILMQIDSAAHDHEDIGSGLVQARSLTYGYSYLGQAKLIHSLSSPSASVFEN